MVLSGYGVEVSESELRELCDCMPDGTDSLHAVRAAQRLGFEGTRRLNRLTLGQLASLVADGLYPYVEVNMLPIDGVRAPHALVVLAISPDSVTVYDPHSGEREIPVAAFIEAWRARGFLATVVSRSVIY